MTQDEIDSLDAYVDGEEFSRKTAIAEFDDVPPIGSLNEIDMQFEQRQRDSVDNAAIAQDMADIDAALANREDRMDDASLGDVFNMNPPDPQRFAKDPNSISKGISAYVQGVGHNVMNLTAGLSDTLLGLSDYTMFPDMWGSSLDLVKEGREGIKNAMEGERYKAKIRKENYPISSLAGDITGYMATPFRAKGAIADTALAMGEDLIRYDPDETQWENIKNAGITGAVNFGANIAGKTLQGVGKGISEFRKDIVPETIEQIDRSNTTKAMAKEGVKRLKGDETGSEFIKGVESFLYNMKGVGNPVSRIIKRNADIARNYFGKMISDTGEAVTASNFGRLKNAVKDKFDAMEAIDDIGISRGWFATKRAKANVMFSKGDLTPVENQAIADVLNIVDENYAGGRISGEGYKSALESIRDLAADPNTPQAARRHINDIKDQMIERAAFGNDEYKAYNRTKEQFKYIKLMEKSGILGQDGNFKFEDFGRYMQSRINTGTPQNMDDILTGFGKNLAERLDQTTNVQLRHILTDIPRNIGHAAGAVASTALPNKVYPNLDKIERAFHGVYSGDTANLIAGRASSALARSLRNEGLLLDE